MGAASRTGIGPPHSSVRIIFTRLAHDCGPSSCLRLVCGGSKDFPQVFGRELLRCCLEDSENLFGAIVPIGSESIFSIASSSYSGRTMDAFLPVTWKPFSFFVSYMVKHGIFIFSTLYGEMCHFASDVTQLSAFHFHRLLLDVFDNWRGHPSPSKQALTVLHQ
jgi:hypothetical protein